MSTKTKKETRENQETRNDFPQVIFTQEFFPEVFVQDEDEGTSGRPERARRN